MWWSIYPTGDGKNSFSRHLGGGVVLFFLFWIDNKTQTLHSSLQSWHHMYRMSSSECKREMWRVSVANNNNNTLYTVHFSFGVSHLQKGKKNILWYLHSLLHCLILFLNAQNDFLKTGPTSFIHSFIVHRFINIWNQIYDFMSALSLTVLVHCLIIISWGFFYRWSGDRISFPPHC